jgi:hypothetical protein
MTVEKLRNEFNALMEDTQGYPEDQQLLSLLGKLSKIKKTDKNISEHEKLNYDIAFHI